MLGMVGVNRCAQIFKPPSGGLIRHRAVARRDTDWFVVFVRGAGRPVDKVPTELRLELRDLLRAEECVQIQ
jgi:hypothetical protein